MVDKVDKFNLDARAYLSEEIPKGQWTSASVSIGKAVTYIQQYIKRGSPRWLDEGDRELLARLYDLDENRLKPPPRSAPVVKMKKDLAQHRREMNIDIKAFCHVVDDPRAAQLLRLWSSIESDSDKTLALRLIAMLAKKPDAWLADDAMVA